jgi:type I restriction enzyme S subunit
VNPLSVYDVLVNSTGVGTLGRVAQVKRLMEKATVDSHVTIVRPDITKIDPLYFGYAMILNQSKIEAMGEGATGQTELSRTRLGQEVFVPVPTLAIQKRIGEILSAYDELIENSQRRIKILEQMARNLYREWFVQPRRSNGYHECSTPLPVS